MWSSPQCLFTIYGMEVSDWLLVPSPSASTVGVQCLAGLGIGRRGSHLN